MEIIGVSLKGQIDVGNFGHAMPMTIYSFQIRRWSSDVFLFISLMLILRANWQN